MLYSFLVTLFVFLCLLLVLIILVQKSRSSMGLGGLGGGAQMLFGGSGGQDLFQKVTWVMVALFMFGSLVLSLMKSSGNKTLSYNIRPKMATSSAAPANPTRKTTSSEPLSATPDVPASAPESSNADNN